MNDFDTLHEQGLADRGDLLGEPWQAPPPAAPVEPPRLEGQPAFPEPGIYFGMPEADYHAIHAVSASGLKKLAVSSMDYFMSSPLNPDPPQERKDYFDFGKAIHTLVLEGEEAYAERYVIGLDKASFDNLLETTDQIKAAIAKLGQKPTTKGYDDLSRSAKKDDWIAQLLDLDPDAKIWDRIKAEFDAEHAEAEVISYDIDRRVRIAAKMILAHSEIAEALEGGYSEVSIFWYCPVTGCPMKARLDRLTLRRIIDLKSFNNKGGMPIDRAIERTIAAMRYTVQHVVYDEAVEAAKRLIRERGIEAIVDCAPTTTPGIHEFCEKLAEQPEPDFLFIFQSSGLAPVTRGKIMPREEMGVFGVTRRRIEELKRAWIANCEVYGTDMWLDLKGIETIEDEALPLWASEI